MLHCKQWKEVYPIEQISLRFCVIWNFFFWCKPANVCPGDIRVAEGILTLMKTWD